MRSTAEALALVRAFDASTEEEKSRELILALLECSSTPFSRDQFEPGHITCTAAVLHPEGNRVLLMHHHRHKRWLLPGGHVEDDDVTLGDAARREAIEETAVRIAPASAGTLAGMDVHGIPSRKREPFHLHHDLIFSFHANSEEFAVTEEAPKVAWCGLDEFARYSLPSSITRAVERALLNKNR
ncbi:MAG TPA: NUDIX domain-containing protein [Bryobacteraceae bacterium]|jgi:8-oxo-dGTP pyrophosphatase MutT (NUDIX family)|nr:NUDIX domain-containing protein [Bryobacteraceae bacterium]